MRSNLSPALIVSIPLTIMMMAFLLVSSLIIGAALLIALPFALCARGVRNPMHEGRSA
jgi:hypothetical protein